MESMKPIEPGCRAIILPINLRVDRQHIAHKTVQVIDRVDGLWQQIYEAAAGADAPVWKFNFEDSALNNGKSNHALEYQLMRIDDDDQIAKDDKAQKSKPKEPVIVR